MTSSAPVDTWDEREFAAKLHAMATATDPQEIRRNVVVTTLRLRMAMLACGIPAPESATGNELLDLCDWYGREKMRRLGLPI